MRIELILELSLFVSVVANAALIAINKDLKRNLKHERQRVNWYRFYNPRFHSPDYIASDPTNEA